MQTDRHDGNLSAREVRTTSASDPELRVAEIHTAGPGPARTVPGSGSGAEPGAVRLPAPWRAAGGAERCVT